MIKKFVFKFKWWFITPLESDTILSYIFSLWYDRLKDIVDEFVKWENVPFLISNWFYEWELPKPVHFKHYNEEEKLSLNEEIKSEKTRKKLKNLDTFNIDLELFKKFIDEDVSNKEYKSYYEKKYLNNRLYDTQIRNITIPEFKNSIPRFNKGDTSPYPIQDIKYTNHNFVVYVKIFDENKYNQFEKEFINIFWTIWWWKWKSKWYWKIESIEVRDIDNNENDLFNYFEELRNNGIYFVLNNYKPSEWDLSNIDLEKSNISWINKNWKSIWEFIFKWQFSFVWQWSLLYADNWLNWSYYKFGSDNSPSFNFWYIF